MLNPLPVYQHLAAIQHLMTCIGRGGIVSLIAISLNAVYAQAPYLPSSKPITDAQGRLQVIVDFVETARQAYPQSPVLTQGADTLFHRAQTVNFVADFAKKYQFAQTGMTSWVGDSVTGYVTLEQLTAIRADKVVKQVSAVAPVEFSAQPPWGNTANGAETWSWGRNAIGGRVAAGSNRRVYIIDSGVADHRDLKVISRVNVACGSAGDCGNATPYALVGCYAHATHVAGIIGAKVNTSNITTAGVYANVGLYSVGIMTRYFSPGDCGNVSVTGFAGTTDRIGYALDYIYRDTLQNGNGKVSIVNMSMNPGGVGWEPMNGTWIAQPNYSKVISLTSPASNVYDASTGTYRDYPGAVFVQSAGNNDTEVCGSTVASRAFTPYAPFIPGSYPPNYSANANDGILVVGALHHTGDTVNSGINSYPALPFSGSYPSGLSETDPASNFGACVDIWAPGNLIASTWGDNQSWPNTVYGIQYTGNVPYGSAGWAYLSGTSMAAPHIAAVAAYLADVQGLTTPSAIEQAVRAKSVQLKSSDYVTPSAFYDPSGTTYVRDRANLLVRMPQLP